MGRTAEAIEKLDKAVALEPGLKGRADELREKLAGGKDKPSPVSPNREVPESKAPKVAPPASAPGQDAAPYVEMGKALVAAGKHAEACDSFAEAVKINPQCADAYLNWGLALKSLGKNAEAMGKLDMAAKIDPTLKPQVEKLRAELER
jgi:tetratricopeptide (TPR) repeat protein